MRCTKNLLMVLLLLLCTNFLYAQTVLTGVVTDPDGNKLQSVNVTAPKSGVVSITDATGKFKISVPVGTSELEFSIVGYQTQMVKITGKTDFAITLVSTANALKDVVVVGYGTQRKKDVTGTISSVKGDDFKNLPVSNSAQALQGRASGVDIVRTDGAPGSVPSIRIRGTGTINNSDPLIVIDGVPAGSLNDVNPNDIASIEVLKDASSSAIYGTRAANGVVLITTKKGSFGDQMKTTVNIYTGNSNVTKTLDLLTAPQLVELKKEEFANDGSPVPAIWNDSYYATQRTDWQDALYGTGTTNNADIAMRGGNAKSRYSISANYFDDKGIIVNSFFKRVSTSLNSEHKLGNRIRVGENFLYSYSSGNAPDTRSTQAGLVWSALRFNPAIPVFNDDGTWGSSKADNELGDINNPVFTAATTDRDNTSRRVLANVYGELDLIKGLMLKVNYAFDQTLNDNYSFDIATPNQTRVNSLATLTQSHSESTSWLQEIFLTYNTQIKKSHNIGLTAGYSAQTFAGNYFFAQRRGYADPADDHRILDNGSSANQFSGGNGNNRPYAGLQSYFVRGNYSYLGKYLLTATMRADGSSKFPPGKQWGYFPAFSAGWRISDESFFKDNITFLTTLKLTGGWGQLGNQNISDFQYLAIIRSGGGGTQYSFGTNGNVYDGSYVVSLSNPNITWERAEMTNVSLEFGLLKNHLTGTLTYFNKDTKGMLIPYSLVENYGANSSLSYGSGNITIPYQNLGTLNNRGIELDLTYQNKVGNLGYSIGANASFIKNKVTYLYGTKADYIGSVLYGRESLETSRTYEGQPISSYYGFQTAGLYQNQSEIDKAANIANDPNKGSIQPGDVKFVDQNGDGIINDNDRVNLGNPNPGVVLGINGSASYKGFDLSFSFAGAFGFELYNADRMAGLDATQVFNLYQESMNRWHGEGTSNSIPRLTRANTNQNYRSSDLWIEKGDYLALKNISIGYTLSKWNIAKAAMPDTRFYVSCYNAFILTGYSGYTPELGYTDGNKQRGVDVAQYPAVRTFTIGATLNF
ncbi:SusC/RagA family TonB-linked outer membrane protein [Limnovirga soli]|uniref:SusC/RagA family TonB-linked outer membrane protein n=1 Tax=Limnovirga soli TaxID=2656915 RepID=A0A8J8JYR8_9BACT|nr:TonB-dependent receptor [Limnovirga soli]NNV57576.1 SusC/RagA family TonB-linked outer membrane protein [Limnovirga soli]